jgi:hypothetical protein
MMHTTHFGTCLVAFATLGACGGPVTGDVYDPVIDDVSPHQGDYGATVTVRGTHLENSAIIAHSPDGEVVTLLPAVDPNAAKAPADPKAPPDPPLTFRFPFPAEGEMTLTGHRFDVSLGAFTPSWAPGQPARLDGQRVLGAVALGGDTAVLVDGPRGASFVVFGAGAPRTFAVAASPMDVTSATLRVVGTKVEALLAGKAGFALATFDGTTASAQSYAPVEGALLGVGADDNGFVVVARTTEDKIARLRGAPPMLVQVGASVPVPGTVSAGKGVLGVSGNGTVVHGWSGAAGNFLDDVASFSMAGLAPTADDFGATESLGSLDDVFKNIEVEVKGGVVHLSYCAVDTGLFSAPTDRCGSAATVDGVMRLDVSGATSGDGAVSLAAGKLSVATCDEHDVMVIRSGMPGTAAGIGEPSIYPCTSATVHAIASDDAGTRIVVEQANKIWVTRRR